MASIDRVRAYEGPALFSYGFRPFFLVGALFAGLAMLAWLPLLDGRLALPTAFSARDWHVHEMLFGYLPAVITGFLLTAVPNWTGRLPLCGRPLIGLVLVWAAGRIVVAASAWTGWLVAAAVDVAFLVLLGAVVAREIVAGANWRNLKVLAIVALLAAGNIAFHVEAHLAGFAEHAPRVGLAAAIGLVMLIGGRIVPSFTRNWLVRENPGRLPAPFDRFDLVALATAGLALAAWVLAPGAAATGWALLIAGALQAVRLARWAGDRTLADRLVLVLHVAYAFIPLGFVLLAFAALAPSAVPASAGVHAWTSGAIGTMTLAVMSRATRGHSGRPLVAGAPTEAVYLLVAVAALLRILGAFAASAGPVLLLASGLCWAAAFLGFVLIHWRMLTGPRLP